MNPKRNVTALDTVKYGIVMMLANLGGTIAALVVLSLLRTVTSNRLLVLVLCSSDGRYTDPDMVIFPV